MLKQYKCTNKKALSANLGQICCRCNHINLHS